MNPYRIVIIDDHELLRRGIIATLNETWEIAGQAANLTEAKSVFRNLPDPPGLVILDIALPSGEWGLELLPWLKTRYGKTPPPVLVYSAYADWGHIQAALAMGAKGCVSKDEGLPMLEKAMLAAVRGQTFINQELYSRFPDAPEFQDSLTRQEKQVLILAQKGWDNGRIGTELSLSRRTVEWYFQCIYAKLGLKSRKALLSLKPGN